MSLSVPGEKIESRKLQSRSMTTCRKVIARMFFAIGLVELPDRTSAARVLRSFLAFSLTFFAGKNCERTLITFETRSKQNPKLEEEMGIGCGCGCGTDQPSGDGAALVGAPGEHGLDNHGVSAGGEVLLGGGAAVGGGGSEGLVVGDGAS